MYVKCVQYACAFGLFASTYNTHFGIIVLTSFLRPLSLTPLRSDLIFVVVPLSLCSLGLEVPSLVYYSTETQPCTLFHLSTSFIIEETTVIFVLCNLITCLFRLWARLWPILHLLSTAFCYVCYLVHFTFSKQICYRVKMAELSENSLSESVKGCVWFTCKCIYYSFFNRYDDTLSFKYGKCITFRILKWRERMKQLSSLQLNSFKKLGQSLV